MLYAKGQSRTKQAVCSLKQRLAGGSLCLCLSTRTEREYLLRQDKWLDLCSILDDNFCKSCEQIVENDKTCDLANTLVKR